MRQKIYALPRPFTMILLLVFLFGAVHGETLPRVWTSGPIVDQCGCESRWEYRWKDTLYTVRNDHTWLIKDKWRQCVRSDDVHVTPSNCGDESELVQNTTEYWKSSEYVSWTTAIERCEQKNGKLFDQILLSEDEGKEICSKLGAPNIWSSWWSPANSGVWKNNLTGALMSQDDIDWYPGSIATNPQPDDEKTKDRVAVYSCTSNTWWDFYTTWTHSFVCNLAN